QQRMGDLDAAVAGYRTALHIFEELSDDYMRADPGRRGAAGLRRPGGSGSVAETRGPPVGDLSTGAPSNSAHTGHPAGAMADVKVQVPDPTV
ncbi:hypothetical protein ACWD3D_34015, partial [Streptomyces sp. NPDC002690]